MGRTSARAFEARLPRFRHVHIAHDYGITRALTWPATVTGTEESELGLSYASTSSGVPKASAARDHQS